MSDREEFEDWVDHKFGGPAGRHISKCDGVYLNGSVQAAWAGWQAAKDNYAPKLTQAEAARIAEHALSELLKDEDIAKGFRPLYRAHAKAVITAIKAAGVKFRDEA
ncbi:MAG TPA: hypothetical protein VHW09_27300 [Bryobacteraceae bacterium]|jgi:hypothetical protein|nr:hypothetical protein [Bryobacteraceae bacterium]